MYSEIPEDPEHRRNARSRAQQILSQALTPAPDSEQTQSNRNSSPGALQICTRSRAVVTRTLLWAIRSFLGALFLATGIGKLLDNRGFAQVIATYELGIPEPGLLPLALGISLLELAVGINILRGRRLKQNVLATLVFHIGYTALAATTLVRGLPIENCGCFGVFLARPLRWSMVGEDLALTAVSAVGVFLLSNRSRRT
ncbi:MAG: MauE/DoxX family redox-associated membrane protein [Gammaproteobacteria bacterium]